MIAVEFWCVPGVRFPVRLNQGYLNCATKDRHTFACAKACNPAAKEKTRWRGKGEQTDPRCDFGNPGSEWCSVACKALGGCNDDPAEYTQEALDAKKKAKKAPPAELTSEAACRADEDCSVSNGRSCCGCKTIEVHSRLEPHKLPPACGCGNFGAKQELAELTGDESGPCGGMPPDAGEYRAVCRNRACVGVRR